jgi:hypothetical protein
MRLFSMLGRAPASIETLPSAPFWAPVREPSAAKSDWKQISGPLFRKYITMFVGVLGVLLVSNVAFEPLSLPLCRYLDLDELAGR